MDIVAKHDTMKFSELSDADQHNLAAAVYTKHYLDRHDAPDEDEVFEYLLETDPELEKDTVKVSDVLDYMSRKTWVTHEDRAQELADLFKDGVKIDPILMDGHKLIDGAHRARGAFLAGIKELDSVDVGPLMHHRPDIHHEEHKKEASAQINLDVSSGDARAIKEGVGDDALDRMAEVLLKSLQDSVIPSMAKRFGITNDEVESLLAEINWKIIVDPKSGARASFNFNTDTISVEANFLWAAIEEKNNSELIHTLMHELEHWLQDKAIDLSTVQKKYKSKGDKEQNEYFAEWLQDPREQGALVNEIRHKLDSGISEDEILSEYFPEAAPQIRTLIEVAKDSMPEAVIASKQLVLAKLNKIAADVDKPTPGGKADEKSVEDIAQDTKVSKEHVLDQLEKGQQVEFEHTSDPEIAKDIAKDHLEEYPNYYTDLEKMKAHSKHACWFKKAQEDSMVDSYLRTALWAETDGDGKPLDDMYSVENFSPEAKEEAANDCREFEKKAAPWIRQMPAGVKLDQLGMDFWLTRNGHGSGFWDREEVYGKDVAQALTKIAEEFGEVNVAPIGDKDDESALEFV